MFTLHSAERDRALGLLRPGARTMSLLDWRRKRNGAALTTLAQAAFLRGVISECQTQVRALIDGADTPEKRREILPKAERLNELAGNAAAELEKLSHAG